MNTQTIEQLPLATFWWSRCRFHMGLNAVRVVAVFTALQILGTVTFLFADTSDLTGIVLLFFTVVKCSSFVFNRLKTSPRYLWVACSIFGHVAGFSFKSFVFFQVKYFHLSENVWLILLALLLVFAELLVFGCLRGCLSSARKAVAAQCKENSSTCIQSCCSNIENEKNVKYKVRVKTAVVDVYAESFSFIIAYLVYAFFKAAIRGMNQEQIKVLFHLEEPPCFRHEESHHNSSDHGNVHGHGGDDGHSNATVHGRRRADAEEEHTTWINNDGILLLVFLICFFVLPVLEYWLRAAAHQLQLNNPPHHRIKSVLKETTSTLFGVLSSAVPVCMAYQAHGLITDWLEGIAEDASVSDATLLLYIALSAAFGFFFSSTFPPLTDVKNEKRRRLNQHTEHDDDAEHDVDVHHDEGSKCDVLTYRSKMLSPSHKEMWAIWVGLLCEIFVNCLVSQTMKYYTYLITSFAILLFVLVGYLFGQDYAQEFEHHVEHQFQELMELSRRSNDTSFAGDGEDDGNVYIAL